MSFNQIEIIRHHLVEDGWVHYREVDIEKLQEGYDITRWLNFEELQCAKEGSVLINLGDWDFAELEIEYKNVIQFFDIIEKKRIRGKEIKDINETYQRAKNDLQRFFGSLEDIQGREVIKREVIKVEVIKGKVIEREGWVKS